jgi:cytochrome c biogenesis protein ResB
MRQFENGIAALQGTIFASSGVDYFQAARKILVNAMMLLALLLGSLILARVFRFEWYWYLIIVLLWLLGAIVIGG